MDPRMRRGGDGRYIPLHDIQDAIFVYRETPPQGLRAIAVRLHSKRHSPRFKRFG